jgi:hydrogenase/urease accessory protein HupE
MTLRAAIWTILGGVLLVVGLLAPSHAEAHSFRPALLDIEWEEKGVYRVAWKVSTRRGEVSPGATLARQLDPRLPDFCTSAERKRTERRAGAAVTRWRVDCGDRALSDGSVGVAGLAEASTDVLVRFRGREGGRRTGVLRAGAPTLTLAEPAAGQTEEHRAGGIFGTYLVLGIEHILFGFDHLLFVLGLLLLVGDLRTLTWTITAFTAAHSLTLAGATLGWVSLPSGPVEATIALSIVLLAVEAVEHQEGRAGWTARYPWAVSFGFGLLHGLGFAGVLADIGLPADDLPAALLAFNLGVEVGQLAFVLAAAGAFLLARRLARRFEVEIGRPAAYVCAYTIGVIASYWSIVRVVGIVS